MTAVVEYKIDSYELGYYYRREGRVPKIKSPLRYPGGKSRALKKILPFIPTFSEYREPFIGGGSVFIALEQLVKRNQKFLINDLNHDLFCFWKTVKDDLEEMVKEVRKIKKEEKEGRALYEGLMNDTFESVFEKGVRFFVLNRITFSGLSDSGGYSKQAFNLRFTDSCIDRLEKLGSIMKNVEIMNKDYEELLHIDGKDVFIFLDPPYFKSRKSRLYGNDGDLHINFSHKRFAKNMKKCPHKWLITYDDSKEIRGLFEFANKYEWTLQYGMNNYKQDSAKKGKELFITNYVIEEKKEKSSVKTFDNF
ncbi:MAG: D12 class N6 adenine-specific DNA methyltransferase [Promethearchaeota archaeon]|nr:MAG: D12 class N6 adenine-specific DNA methyltransferase [Candidatus Lokiarchaeota archaeon]